MSFSAFDSAFNDVLGIEGRYSDNPNDSGGATKYGITERVARANGYRGDMRALTEAEARVIAKNQYWDTLRLDMVAAASPAIAREMFDTGYNMGIGVAGKALQRALNAFNHRGADYPDVEVDGLVGPLTVDGLRAYLARRGREGEGVLLRAMNALQGVRYIELSEARQKDEDFVYGWIKNRVQIGGTA